MKHRNEYCVRLFLTIAFIVMSVMAFAQDMTVKAPSSVFTGQRFHVRYEVNDRARDFKGPDFKGFSVLSGPSISNSSSTSWINGQVSHSVTTGFDYIIQADVVGSFTVGSASCTVEGKKVSCPSFTIKVEKGQPNQNQQSQQNYAYGRSSQQYQQQSAEIDGNSLFARASISKTNPYQGEQVIIVYKVYTQIPISQFTIDKLPGNKGFWSEDLSENQTQVKQYEETYNGRQYQVAEIRRGAMFAQESGNIKIEPLDLDVLAMVRRQPRRTGTIWDLFDDPFFNSAQAVEKHLTTNSLRVNVKPLPPSPEGFCGGVGSFDVKGGCDHQEVKANEAITYTVTIHGSGNIMLINAPTIEFPQVFEVYDPENEDRISRSDNGVSGTRTFKWVLIPRSEGQFEIPEFQFAYFDPKLGQYVTRTIPSVSIKVNPGDPKAMQSVTNKSDIKVLNSDINYIKTRPVKLSTLASVSAVPVFLYVGLGLIVLLWLITFLILRHLQVSRQDVVGTRLRRATKEAKKRLRKAESYLKSGNDERFYEEIYRAIWGCLADKFNIALSRLSSDTVQECLIEKNVDAPVQERILETLRDVDFARFAPGDKSARKQQIYEEALQMIASL